MTKGPVALKKEKKIKQPRYRLGLLSAFILAVLLTGFICVLCLWIQPNSLRAVLKVFYSQPLLVILNCLPFGLLVLAFSFLFRNVFSAANLVGTCCAVLSMVNSIKLDVRDEPLFPRDFALVKEAGSAVHTYAIQWPWPAICAIFCFFVAMKLCARLVGCKPFPIAALRNWGGRLLGFSGTLVVLAALVLTVYASNSLYNSFSVSNPYYIPSVFNELGFPYCFCHNFTTYAVEKPDGFSKAEAASWDAAETTGKGENVNVIIVMNEAFSDLTDYDVFTYSKQDDPLKYLHAAQSDSHCISGHIVVPGFAGGTANTEFDVLTGMQTNALSSTTTSAFRAVNRNLDSLFRVFGADGYRTLFMHPGYDWFYNRENVYRWLGAGETMFVDQMKDPTYKGTWVTDDYMAGLIEQQFEKSAAEGVPLFNYTTTIQNHMSYTADKYGPGYEFPPVQTSVKLSDQAQTLLSVYIEGVRDADAMLGRLTDYFRNSDAPTVLVFYGDHLPYLGDNELVYRELGLEIAKPESQRTNAFCAYETPYVIWANDAAAKTLNWDNTVASLGLPADGDLSACYMGATILELTGRSTENPWFEYLTQVRRQLPIIQKKTCETADGSVVPQNQLSDVQQQMISKLHCWSYYKLKYKEVG